MSGGIYLIQDDGDLLEMKEETYGSEDMLQALLAKYPNLLAGDQMDTDSPRRWLLVKREAEVPSEDSDWQWSVDHLFIDQDGIPTLVEVKRSSDTRIRRECVGQMLDYAANAVVHWSLENIVAKFEARCEKEGIDPHEAVKSALEVDPDMFWEHVKTNLQAGKVRMVFVADEIPKELRRIVEFLNEQMDPAEVLAVEVKQYVGQGRRTLVPRVVGQTEQKRPASQPGRQWDEVSFFADLQKKHGDGDTAVARKLLDWSKARAFQIFWGRGKETGSFAPWLELPGKWLAAIVAYTNGVVEVRFGYLRDRGKPFSSIEKRKSLLERLNAIQGVHIPADRIDYLPSIQMPVLHDDAAMQQFLDVLDWVIDEVRSDSSERTDSRGGEG